MIDKRVRITLCRTRQESRLDRPLHRTTLRDEIKDRIVERILDGTYGPGDRIVESQASPSSGPARFCTRGATRP